MYIIHYIYTKNTKKYYSNFKANCLCIIWKNVILYTMLIQKKETVCYFVNIIIPFWYYIRVQEILFHFIFHNSLGQNCDYFFCKLLIFTFPSFHSQMDNLFYLFLFYLFFLYFENKKNGFYHFSQAIIICVLIGSIGEFTLQICWIVWVTTLWIFVY